MHKLRVLNKVQDRVDALEYGAVENSVFSHRIESLRFHFTFRDFKTVHLACQKEVPQYPFILLRQFTVKHDVTTDRKHRETSTYPSTSSQVSRYNCFLLKGALSILYHKCLEANSIEQTHAPWMQSPALQLFFFHLDISSTREVTEVAYDILPIYGI